MVDESTNDEYHQEIDNDLRLLESSSYEENKFLVENGMDNDESKFSDKSDTQNEQGNSRKLENSNKQENTVKPLDNQVKNSEFYIKQGSKIKNNFETKSLWQHNYNIFRAKSDRRCRAHCFAKHVYKG